MLHLLYLDVINQGIISINNKNVNVKISDYTKNKYSNYEILLGKIWSLNRNNFLFNIYKDNTKITKKDPDVYVNKDVVYLYINKTKAYRVTYDVLHEIFVEKINSKDVSIDKDIKIMYTNIHIDYLLKKLKNPKDITKLISDMRYVYTKEKQKLPYETPQSIIDELHNL